MSPERHKEVFDKVMQAVENVYQLSEHDVDRIVDTAMEVAKEAHNPKMKTHIPVVEIPLSDYMLLCSCISLMKGLFELLPAERRVKDEANQKRAKLLVGLDPQNNDIKITRLGEN